LGYKTDWITKQDPSFCCTQEIYFSVKNKYHLQEEGFFKKIFKAKEPKKQANIVILISDKTDFKPKLIRRYKKEYFLAIKGIIHQQQCVTILNIYIPNTRALKFIKGALLQLQSHNDPDREGNRSCRQNLKGMLKLNVISNGFATYKHNILTNHKRIYLFSASHETFSKTEHILAQSKPQQI
jgi:exonuclease III